MKLARIDVFSHGMRLSGYGLRFAHLIGHYLRDRCLHLRKRRDPRTRRMVTDTINTYAAARSDYSEVYLLREQLKSFLDFIFSRGIRKEWLEIVYHDPVPGKEVEFVKKWKFPWREDQQEWLEYMNGGKDTPFRMSLNTAQTGSGKSLINSTPVKVPGGWRQLGDLKIGDTITAANGRPTKVTNIFDHKAKQLYEIVFADGRRVEACGEHLWACMRPNWGWDKNNPYPMRVINTLEMIRILELSNKRLYIPYCESEHTPDADLPLDPYVLGVLLGDGHLIASPTITTPDDFILNKVLSRLPDDCEIRYRSKYDYAVTKTPAAMLINKGGLSETASALDQLGLMGKRAWEKFVPKQYMMASHRQRCEILAGLIDTDGTVDKGGSIVFCTSSKQLSDDVIYLVRSIGGYARLRIKQPYYTYKGERHKGRLAYMVTIRYKRPHEIVTLPKKLERCPVDGQYFESMLRVLSIKPSRVADARCITIDDPSALFVVKDFIVTHNTAMSQEIVFRRGVRTGIILSPRYMPGWRSSLLNFFGMEPGDVIEIRGNAKEDPPHPDIPRYSMLEFQTLVEQGELDFKIALFSLNMFQRYIADYEKNNCVAPYAFHPAEFWEKTGIGLLIHDECHEALHFLFKVKCYASIPEIIYLSATAVSDDPFIERMLYLMYPKEARYAKGEYKKYIAVNAVTYRLRSTDKVRYKGFGGSYSHTIFEQSIMKNKQLKLAYFNFIYTVIIKGFMNQYQEGMKMLVYCATVDMCKSLSHYLSERIPELEIGPYTAEEDFMVLLDNDISVTTVKSAGTGIDLPDLVMTFMTLAMGSRTGNIQVLGRLRQLKGKFEGMTPTFWYLVCTSIEAHRKYHQRKVEFFSDKVLTQRVIDEDFEL